MWFRQASSSSGAGGSEWRKRSVSRTQPSARLMCHATPSGPPSTSSVEPPPTSITSVPSEASPPAKTPLNVISASSSPESSRVSKP